MAEVNDHGPVLRRTRATQPAANTVNGGTLCFITDEGKLERSNSKVWESYSAAVAGADPEAGAAIVNIKQAVGALIVFLSQGPNAVLRQDDAETLQRILDGEPRP